MALKKLAWWGSHRVAPGSSDIRGWRVLDGAGVGLGSVVDLIFDDERGLARYVGLDIAGEKLLVPVEALELRPPERIAILIGGQAGPAMTPEGPVDGHHPA